MSARSGAGERLGLEYQPGAGHCRQDAGPQAQHLQQSTTQTGSNFMCRAIAEGPQPGITSPTGFNFRLTTGCIAMHVCCNSHTPTWGVILARLLKEPNVTCGLTPGPADTAGSGATGGASGAGV